MRGVLVLSLLSVSACYYRSVNRLVSDMDEQISIIRSQIQKGEKELFADFYSGHDRISPSMFGLFRDKVLAEDAFPIVQCKYDELKSKKAELLGKYVKVSGLLIRTTVEQIGGDRYYQLLLVDEQLNVFIIYLVREPDNVMYVNEDYVSCGALFARLVKAVVNGEDRLVPVFMAKKIDIYY